MLASTTAHAPDVVVSPSERYVRERLGDDEVEEILARDRAIREKLATHERADQMEKFKARIERLKDLRARGEAPTRVKMPAVRAPRVTSEAGTSSRTSRGNVMAEKKVKKVKEAAAPREISRPVGKVSDFVQVRSGARRVIVETITGGSATVDDLARATGHDRKALFADLHCMNRDSGIGYEIKNDKVTLSFPGDRTWRDALRPLAEPKAAKEPKKKAA